MLTELNKETPRLFLFHINLEQSYENAKLFIKAFLDGLH
jgi:hypothetical protein